MAADIFVSSKLKFIKFGEKGKQLKQNLANSSNTHIERIRGNKGLISVW
jgi:hypothetical protein